MCFMKTPDMGEPQQIQEPARMVDTNVQQARTDQQRRARAAAGAQSTITPGLSASPVTTTQKTLLGQ